MSRLGRSLGQVLQIVATLIKRKIRFIAIKEAVAVEGKQETKGALGKSKLDGKEEDIRMLLGKEVSKASIAKILDVSRSALYHFIETRKIVPD